MPRSPGLVTQPLPTGRWCVVSNQTAGSLLDRTTTGRAALRSDECNCSLDSFASFQFGSGGLVTGGGGFTIACPTSRYSLSSTTTIYPDANPTFTVSTMLAYGIVWARRLH